MKRLELERDEARLEHAEPVAGRRVRHPSVVAEALQVEELADSPGAQPDETLERGQVTNLRDLANVALDVGLEVVPERPGRLEGLVVDARVEAGVDHDADVEIRSRPARLLDRKRQQREDGGSSGERLADRLAHAQLATAGEDELAVPLPLVDGCLDVRRQLRHPLDLVEHRPVAALSEEP